MIKLIRKDKEYFMRKILFFPVILALCVVDSASFGATRASRGSGATPTATPTTTKAPVANVQTTAARAASVRNSIKTTVNPGTTSARSAMQTPAAPKTARSATNTQKVTTARAGSTKKVISTGTKVEVAKENTLVSQECQDAYYGCMDAFCMLDNASGGRCQCSDRNAELDSVLEEILKLDEQSYALATEGVERLQMGDNADVVMARAKAAADKVTKETLTAKEATKKKRTLDLSAWNTNLFSDDEEDNDIFGDSLTTMESKFADKKGDDLHTAAAKLCTKQLPEQCQSAGGILQLTYASKVRSDCSAYENSLKQQRNSSQQKLLTAQKALRDTALEMYENENKYDLGQCVIQYKQCMQTTAECGTDFSGCIADTAILQALYNSSKGGKGGVPTTAVKTGTTTITISSATYDILNNKKLMCENVTKQCINANKNDAVWKTVLKEIVPAVYTAEYSAASNSRMNCISTIVSCVQKTCGSQWDENSDNYDACLSDPDLVIQNTCTLEAARCGDVGSSSRVMEYVRAKLAAIRVDKCTQEVKECLLSEDRCGPDYAGCIGLDTDTIVDLCAEEKLIACSEKYNVATVRDYIARVAQGLALNIDNSFAQQCQNAANAAVAKICGTSGDEEENQGCPGLILSNNEIKDGLRWQFCRKGQPECYDELSSMTDERIKLGKVEPRLTGRLDLSLIGYDETGKGGVSDTSKTGEYFYVNGETRRAAKDGYTDTDNSMLQLVIASMNRDYISTMDQVNSDPTIDACINGKTFQMIGDSNREANGGRYSNNGNKVSRFGNLMHTTHITVSNEMLGSVFSKYNNEITSLMESGKKDSMYDEIVARYQKIIMQEMAGKDPCEMSGEEYALLLENQELIDKMKHQQDVYNSDECLDEWNREADFTTNGQIYAWWTELFGSSGKAKHKLVTVGTSATYDAETNTCIITAKTYQCKTTRWLNENVCKVWDTSTYTTEQIKRIMPEWNDKDAKAWGFCGSSNTGGGQ